MSRSDQILLVDASAFITLVEIGHVDLISHDDGYIEIPVAVEDEITDDPAATTLDLFDPPFVNKPDVREFLENDEFDTKLQKAASHLGVANPTENWHGDVALLVYALALRGHDEDVVIITDDKPLRKTCRALSIPISGSIGVLIRAVERGDLDREKARSALYAMDEVGARLSASLVRRAEQLIEEAENDD